MYLFRALILHFTGLNLADMKVLGGRTGPERYHDRFSCNIINIIYHIYTKYFILYVVFQLETLFDTSLKALWILFSTSTFVFRLF